MLEAAPCSTTDWVAAGGLLVAAGTLAFSFIHRRQSHKLSEKQIDASLKVAKLQFRASVLSANRQAWIDRLRENLASYLATTSRVGTLTLAVEGKAPGSALNPKELASLFHDLRKCQLSVELMLNPLDASHGVIIQMMEQLRSLVMGKGIAGKFKELAQLEENITTAAKLVMKSEWERVKHGK